MGGEVEQPMDAEKFPTTTTPGYSNLAPTTPSDRSRPLSMSRPIRQQGLPTTLLQELHQLDSNDSRQNELDRIIAKSNLEEKRAERLLREKKLEERASHRVLMVKELELKQKQLE